jgi:DNA-binding transcriptional LysR family regulator
MFPRRHAFTAHARVPWRMLGREPYIRFSGRRAPAFDSVVADGCRRAGISLRTRLEADHPQTILALVEAGVGVSLLRASAARARSAGVRFRPLRSAGRRLETVMVWRRVPDSAIVRAFAGVVRDVARAADQDFGA